MANSSLNLSEKEIKSITWTLLFIMPIIGMVVDLVAPSLPAIANDLNVSHATSKDVITTFLLGYSLGNFVTGFLTDAWGRQKLLRISLIGFVISSLLPALFPHIEILLISRFLEGYTIGSAAVLARAIISDINPKEKLVRMGSLIGTMWGVGPVFGPVIGGYLQFYLGWKSCFYFLALVTFISFIATYLLVPETHFNRHPLNLKRIQSNFIEVVSHKSFMALPVLMGLAYSLIIVFHTSGPFLIQDVMHYDPVFFGHLALCMGLCFLASTFTSRYIIGNHSVVHIYKVVITIATIIALTGVVLSYFLSQSIGLVVIISGLMFFTTGMLFPMSMGKGMSLFRHISGTASAVMYMINILISSVGSFIISFISIHYSIELFCIYMIIIVLLVIIYWTISPEPCP